ncbi:MAG TPA: DNA methyltransferase [Actinomycetota bacterium]|nr:DNA methyltransferase [Actinomycetota bacterium]
MVDRQQVKSPVHGNGSIIGNRDGGPDERGWDGLPRFNMAATILGYACSCTPFTDHPGSGERQTRDYQPMPDARPQGTYGRKQAGEYQPVGPWREWHLEGWRPPPTRPAVVLDPFAGTGTVPMVARALGRVGVGVDLKADYCKAARWRVRHDGAKAVSRTWAERQGVLL